MYLFRFLSDDCNYWYEQVPKSSNQTNCSTRIGDSITLTCAVYHRCDNISIEWYRSDAEGGDNRSSSERISNTDGGKYLVIQLIGTNAMTPNENFIGCCFGRSHLVINQFSQNETGYYWCQTVTRNRRLKNSPYAFISLHRETVYDPQTCAPGDYINHLNPPICASDFSLSDTRCKLRDQPTNEMYSTINLQSDFTLPTTNNATTTKTDSRNMLWVYLLMTGVIVIVVIVFVVCFIVFYGRYRTLQKQSKLYLTNHSY